jgi:MOSC domain-containing protein YiiM
MNHRSATGETFDVREVCTGRTRTHTHDGRPWRTAYIKSPVLGEVALEPLGLAGDQQADRKHHGGLDKALCVYPVDHYTHWEERLDRELGSAPFGENIAIVGLTEEGAAIGDVFAWGEARVQISEPREPCSNISKRWGEKMFPKWVARTGYTGWYMRVLTPGAVSAEFPWRRLERPCPQWTIARLNRLLAEPDSDPEAVRQLTELASLGETWREKFRRRQ